jgi:hypothetical protein
MICFCGLRVSSFGGERNFEIRPKPTNASADHSSKLCVRLRHGHLLAMNGFFQDEFDHRYTISGLVFQYNITFRVPFMNSDDQGGTSRSVGFVIIAFHIPLAKVRAWHRLRLVYLPGGMLS